MSSGNMERVLRLMSEKGASDVYLSASSPILIKINGQLLQLSDQPLTHAQPRQLLAELLTPSQLEELEDTGELNIGVGLAGVGSFRLSGFKQRGSIAAVFRCIPFEIPTLESLNVPSILSTLVLEKRGLILMVGATGETSYGRIPAGSVVVSGNLPSADGKYSLYCAVIVKRVDAQTRAKTSINDLLRS